MRECKKGKVIKICKYCKIKFYVFHCIAEKYNKGNYCSKKCLGKANGKFLKKWWSKNYPRKKCKCKFCGKIIFIKQSHFIRGRGKYCSYECRNKSKDWRYKLSQASKKAIKEGRRNQKLYSRKGKEHHWWRGGIARLPYPFDFNEKLRQLVRKRDNYKCQKCGAPQEECFKSLDVHHIDFNKENNDPKNLISLCHLCHSKIIKKEDLWKIALK